MEDGTFLTFVVSLEEKKRTRVLRTMRGCWQGLNLFFFFFFLSLDSCVCTSFGI
jgi:hypothetical protein